MCDFFFQPSSDTDEEKFYIVELHRGSRGFGFSIRGGREFNNMPLYVLRIADGGAADLDQRLRVSLECGIFREKRKFSKFLNL